MSLTWTSSRTATGRAFHRLKRAGLLAGASAMVRTRSGGLHVYYAGTAQSCGSLTRHHLDFKAAGGYVLAPPSRVAGGRTSCLTTGPAPQRSTGPP